MLAVVMEAYMDSERREGLRIDTELKKEKSDLQQRLQELEAEEDEKKCSTLESLMSDQKLQKPPAGI
jgi:hypothetical protein